MKKFLLAIFILIPVAMNSQATTGYHRVSQVFTKSSSNTTAQVVPYAKITVIGITSGAAATIYSDPLLTSVISPAVVTADGSGNYSYYIPVNYCVNETISAAGVGSFTVSNVCINSVGSITINGQVCSLGGSCTVTSVPGGSAGGDLSGTYPNPNVQRISVASDLPNNTTATTQIQGDGTSKVATDSYVDTGLALKLDANGLTTSPGGNISGAGTAAFGTVAAGSTNGVVSACAQSGTTADVQIANALAVGGSVDATCYGSATKSWAGTLSIGANNGASTVLQTVTFSPLTIFTPTSNANMIYLGPGGSILGTFHVDLGATGFTGDVVNLSSVVYFGADTVSSNTKTKTTIDHLMIVAGSNTTAKGLHLVATSSTTNFISFVQVNEVYATGLADCINLDVSGTGYINNNVFANVKCQDANNAGHSGINLYNHGTGTNAAILYNVFSVVNYDGLGPAIYSSGAGINTKGNFFTVTLQDVDDAHGAIDFSNGGAASNFIAGTLVNQSGNTATLFKGGYAFANALWNNAYGGYFYALNSIQPVGPLTIQNGNTTQNTTVILKSNPGQGVVRELLSSGNDYLYDQLSDGTSTCYSGWSLGNTNWNVRCGSFTNMYAIYASGQMVFPQGASMNNAGISSVGALTQVTSVSASGQVSGGTLAVGGTTVVPPTVTGYTGTATGKVVLSTGTGFSGSCASTTALTVVNGIITGCS